MHTYMRHITMYVLCTSTYYACNACIHAYSMYVPVHMCNVCRDGHESYTVI